MPIRHGPNRTKILTGARPQRISARPVIKPFPDEEGAFSSVQRLEKRYAKMTDGHRADIRRFLQDCFPVVLTLQAEPDEFERLKADPFWEASRQKPKDSSTAKWVLYFIMRAKTPNVRVRAGRYAVVLDGLIRERVRPDMVAARIKEMGGVEAAYKHFVAAEHGDDEVAADADDEIEDKACPTPRRDGLREAHGGNADKVQGRDESGSSSDRRRGVSIRGRRHNPSFDPERHLLVELEPAELEAILAAGATQGSPISVPLAVVVYPPDATGFVRVIRELEVSDLPEDFSFVEEEAEPTEASRPRKMPLPPHRGPKAPPGKRKLGQSLSQCRFKAGIAK